MTKEATPRKNKSLQSPFDSISSFFEDVGNAITGFFQSVVDFFSSVFDGNSKKSNRGATGECAEEGGKKGDEKGVKIRGIDDVKINLSNQFQLAGEGSLKDPEEDESKPARRSSLGESKGLNETMEFALNKVVRRLSVEPNSSKGVEEIEMWGSPLQVNPNLSESKLDNSPQLDASYSPPSEDEKDKIIISLSILAFTQSDKFGNFLKESNEDKKKNILQGYLQESLPQLSALDQNRVNEIYENLLNQYEASGEGVDKSSEGQSIESSTMSLNESEGFDKFKKEFANIFFGMFLGSKEDIQPGFFEKSSKDKKDVIKNYFEEFFDKNSENEDKLFTKFPELLDAIVDVANAHGPLTQSPRSSGMNAERLFSNRSKSVLHI